MATLQSSIRMMDYFSRPVNNMSVSVGNLIKHVSVANNMSLMPNIKNTNEKIINVKDSLDGIHIKMNENNKKQDDWNNSISKGQNAMGGMLSKLKAAAIAYGGIQGIKNLIGLSDEVMQIDARLNLITDTQEQKNALKDYIYKKSLENRINLRDFNDQVAKVGLLAGDKFKGGNKEIVDYVSTLSKAFKISGADAQGASAAMYQLNQALVSGKLQGDEFRSVMENAPMLAQAIAKQMGVAMVELKKLGAEGKITSDIIRESVLTMSEDVNSKFNTLPLTWKDIWINIKSFSIKSMEPVLKKINEIVNNPKVIEFGRKFKDVFYNVLVVADKFFDITAAGIGWIYEKWNILKYPIIALTGALAGYMALQSITNLILGINASLEMARAVALAVSQGATFTATVAQWGFNAALYAFPGTWIVIGIMAVIGVIIALNKHILGATTIVGTFTGMWSGIKATFYNIWAFVVNVFYSAKDTIIDILNILIDFTSRGLTNYANSYIDVFNFISKYATKFMNGLLGILSKANPLLSKIGIKIPEKIGEAFQLDKININSKSIGNDTKGKRMEYLNVVSEAKKGASEGDKWWNDKKDKFNNITELSDMLNLGGKEYNFENSKNINDIASNTGKMANELEDTEEEMRYLREIAEQEHINKYTTAEIKLDVKNDNYISNEMDLDSIVNQLTQLINEKVQNSVIGVYN